MPETTDFDSVAGRIKQIPWLMWVLVAASVTLGGWVYTVRYAECRAHGFSTFYCAMGR